MKKIYTFTLDGDDCPSSRFDSNLRLFAHMLYETVYTYDDEWHNPLDINKNIVYNNIHDGGSYYYFDSDIKPSNMINYEPFIINGNTCGFTINEDSMSREVIEDLVRYVNSLLKFEYTVKINSYDYVSKDKDDERNRRKAIRLVLEGLGNRISNKSSIVRRLVFPSFKGKML